MEELLNKVNEKLKEHFHGDIQSAEMLYDFPVFTIQKDRIHDVLKFLKEDEELNFHFLTDLCGMQTADEKQLGVIYHLHNMPKNFRIRIKTFVDINHPEISTATDLFGVKFKGHPNLKRILNMEEMDIFPLRKEFPLEDQTRTDKNDSMFGR
jgi:NADH-quinone oxidoreductase subunit C